MEHGPFLVMESKYEKDSIVDRSDIDRLIFELVVCSGLKNGQVGQYLGRKKQVWSLLDQLDKEGVSLFDRTGEKNEAAGIWGIRDNFQAGRLTDGMRKKLKQFFSARLTDPGFGAEAEKVMEIMEREGVRTLFRDDPAYPALLNQIEDPPAVLFCKGSTAHLNDMSIAFSGSRTASAYGIRCVYETAMCCGQKGITIVSGLAKGIDGAAHKAAIDSQAPTIAVLPTSPDKCYPKINLWLYHEILDKGGLVVSEQVPGFPISKLSFVERNRIITGLSPALVVVEASVRSGSIQTASKAMDQGREVYVVPGSIFDSSFVGSHLLIQDGANVLTAPDCLARFYDQDQERMGQDATCQNDTCQNDTCQNDRERQEKIKLLRSHHETPRSAYREENKLTRQHEKWIEKAGEDAWLDPYLTDMGVSGQDIIDRSGKDPVQVLKSISELEIKGLAVRQGGLVYKK